MQAMHDLKEMLCDELKELTKKGELSAGSLDAIDKITHSIKSLVTIMAMEEGGYSRDEGYSGARRRDSMGRYADGASYTRYYDDGYSGRRYSRDEGKSHMVRELENLMQNANQNEREVMEQALRQLKNM